MVVGLVSSRFNALFRLWICFSVTVIVALHFGNAISFLFRLWMIF